MWLGAAPEKCAQMAVSARGGTMELDQTKEYFMRTYGLTEEEALKEIKDAEENPPSENGGHGSRELLKAWAKEYFLASWAERKKSASAKEVCEWAGREKGYHTKDAKGFGDALGNGKGGLNLKPANEKIDGSKAYLIPDPDKFLTWYENDEALPLEYYGREYLMKLDKLQIGKKNKAYFSKRAEITEVSDELE